MTIQDLGAIGEIVGAVAVVATLIYLSIQLKQYNRGLRSSTFHTTMHEYNQINISQLDPALAGLLDKGMPEPESLTQLEKYQFGWIMRIYVNIWENMYQQYLEGACPESYWRPYALQAKAALGSPGGKIFCAGNTLNEGLFSYLESLPMQEPTYDLGLQRKDRHAET